METKVKRYVNFFPSQKPNCSGPTPFSFDEGMG